MTIILGFVVVMGMVFGGYMLSGGDMGIITHAWLKEYRRHAFFGAFVAAAVITPSQDPATMIVMALPLAAFYEAVVLFARIVERRRDDEEDGAAVEPAS